MKRIAGFLLAALITIGASAQQEGLDVVGKVVKYVESDEMMVSTSITAKAETVADAFRIGNERSSAVIAYLKSLEDVCEVQTQYFRLSEQWDYRNGQRNRIGFMAQQNITLKIRDFDQYPTIMQKLIELGVDGISNVQFTYSKADEIREQLRLEAIEVAKKKAQIIATALGVEVGPALHFSEGGFNTPVLSNMEYRAMMTGDAASGPSISPANTMIAMEVHVRFAILAPKEE